MAIVIDLEMRGEGEALEVVEELEQGLAQTRGTLREINEEAVRNGFALRDFSTDLLLLERSAAQQREAMTKESFEKWIGHAAHASDWTRRAFSSTFGAMGRGIADELVDGTHDWRRALKAVLKQMIALTAQMIVMRTLMTALTGGSAGWLGFFHTGGSVLHAAGPARAHSGMFLRDDEVPLIAQRGEFILRRRVVDEIGVASLERMNRGGAAPVAGDVTVNISVNIQEPTDASALVREIGPEIVGFLQRETGRGVRVV